MMWLLVGVGAALLAVYVAVVWAFVDIAVEYLEGRL